MKRILFFIIGLIIFATPSFADTRASILLLHNGQGKSFGADQLQTAVNEAISGDTICLTEGSYLVPNDTLVIDKPLSIIGTGSNDCRVVGNINIAIDGEVSLKARLLDAIKVTQKVIVSKTIKGVKLHKCWIGNFFWVNEDIQAYDIEADRCYFCRFVLKPSVRSAILNNCLLGWQGYNNTNNNIFQEGCNITFINCNIYIFDIYCDVAATYQNCIIRAANLAYLNIIKNNTFINTLFSSNYNSALSSETKVTNGNVVRNCYWYGFTASEDSNNDWYPTFNITKEMLIEKNFLGTDGTIVGVEGGATPYSLEADGIHIKESVLKVDPATRQLNVTLKVE